MKLDTAGLQAFVAIVEHETFQKAGHSLSLSQTGLSRRLQQLERQLGVRLIDRTTRAWSLTAVGAEFLPKARRLIQELESAFTEVRQATRQSRGDVTIACVATAALHFLPETLLRYSRRFPHNRVKILDTAAPEVTAAVLERRAEFGVNVLTRRLPEIDSVTVTHDPFVLMCRDDHPLGNAAQVRWRDLEQEDVILLGQGSGNEVILDYTLSRLKIGLRGRFEAQRPSTAIGLVAAGAGVVVLPSMTLRKGSYPRIRIVPLVEPSVERELGLIKRRDATLSPAAEKLYSYVADAFKRAR
jgi:DNA-binding transcriptional LysR family regulator